MDGASARRRLEEARIARLSTVTVSNRPHVVPCCFALRGETVYFAVDAKPKSTMDLRRLQNLRANPAVSLLVDHYEEDWTTLWWIRVDGSGRMVEAEAERRGALALLGAKYEQYRQVVPPGPVVALDIADWRWWP